MNYLRFNIQLISIIIVSLIQVSWVLPILNAMEQNEMVIFDFKNSDKNENWIIVNDSVMGGLSKSEFFISDSNTAIFRGTVSLENNGGFTSTRTRPRLFKLDEFKGILIRLKGDGKKYQFRIRTNDRFEGVAYRYQFTTEIGQWMTIKVPFNKCVPVFRGRILNNVAPISPKMIQQIGFLIADNQAGQFRLEIKWIKAYK